MNKKMKIAICDDEECVLEEVRDCINEIAKKMNLVIDIHLFQNASDLEREVNERKKYDIVFLDVKIGNIDGIALAIKIKQVYRKTAIIFITGHIQYVFDVFDAQPCGFIKKPIQELQIEHAFNVAVALCEDNKVFTYFVNGKEQKIYLKDIFYITSDKRKIIIKTITGDVEYYGKMNEVEQTLKMLDDNFIRISKYMIIHLKYVERINYCTVMLDINGKSEIFNISQSYRVQVREKNRWKNL